MSCAERGGEEGMLRLMSFVDGELDAAEAAAVRDHIARCPSCREAAEGLRSLDGRIRHAYPERAKGAPDAVKGRLRTGLESRMAATEASARPRARILRLIRRVGAVAAAAAAVLLVVGLVFGLFPDPAAADLVRDHLGCTGMRTDWVTDPAKVADLLAKEVGEGAVLVRFEAAGFRLRGGLVCNVHGQRHVHLAFDADGREPVSVFVARAAARAPLTKTETLTDDERPFAVVRVRGAGGTECVLVAPPAERPALDRLLRDQVRG